MRCHSEIQEMGDYRLFIDRTLICMFGMDESIDNLSSNVDLPESRPIDTMKHKLRFKFFESLL